jgi:GMP synthase (glutamine-hydrolysing)
MPRVCILQHIEIETPGLIGDALADARIATQSFLQAPPSTLAGFDGLVVMGGPQSVYEQDRYPWLRDELRLIADALRAGMPILGVCLGSQLLAAALGARVYPGKQKEIGWYPVTLTEAAREDALLRGLPTTFTPLHWHGDVFDLPPGAVVLASSALTPVQIYRYGANAYGFLCHLEVTDRHVSDWVVSFAGELQSSCIDGAAIRDAASHCLPEVRTLGASVFDRWVSFVLSHR